MVEWRKKIAILFLATAMTLGGALELQAVAPTNIITYQGRVLSANGVPVSDATLSMKFFFYTASSGGSCVWSNSSATCNSNTPGSTTARTVTLTSGLFTQNLGDTSDTFAAIADSTFADNASLYLEVIIGTETLTPRRLITAAPYALNSQTLDGLSSADFDLDRVYDNDSGSALAIDGASGLTFTSSVAANFTVNLASTGDFVVQDNGTAAFTVNDSGNAVVAGDLTVSGDDLFMGTNTSGFLLVADGTNFNPVALSSDATISSTGALTIAANAIALSTDTTGNYVATVADSGNSTVTVSGSGSEGAAVTLNVIDVNCTDCLTTTEIADSYLLNSGDVSTGDLTLSDGTTDSPKLTFTPATGTSWEFYAEDSGDDMQIVVNTAFTETIDLVNGGAGVMDVTIDGGATLGGDLTVSGDDLFMGTNTSGFLLVADGTNFNPVALSSDATISSTGALTIAANAVALSTDTTGNYVATLADAGGSDFTVSGSGSEGAAVTLDIAADAVDWDEIVDAMTLDASSSIAMDGAETFTITDAGTGDVVVNLSSTGDFVVQDNGTAALTVNDAGNTVLAGDLTISGDDLFMGTNTAGFILVGDGTNYNPVDVSGDIDLSSAGAATIQANAIALSTDTTGNYVATVADAGGSDFTISGSGSEGAAVTIDIAADAIDFDEMVDAMSLDAATSITGTAAETFTLTRTGTASAADVITEDGMSLNWTAGVGDSTTDFYHGLEIAVTSANHTAGSIVSALAISNLTSADADGVENAIMIGSGWDRGICFDCDGTYSPNAVDGGIQWGSDANAVTLYRSTADTLRTGDNFIVDLDLTVSGDDITMGTNTSGALLVADGLNFNPVVLSGDATISAAGALAIATNSVALSTDTTGNYVATIADAGGSDFTISGSGSEGAAVTIDIATDAIDWDEIVDATTLDASTSITMDGAETFTFSNGGTGNILFNLTSTGDFVVQDGGSNVLRVLDDSTMFYDPSIVNSNAFTIAAASLTTANALRVNVDALTSGNGVSISSASGVLTSGRLLDVVHGATYSHAGGIVALSGNTMIVDRSITNSSTGTTSITGALAALSSTGTQSAGTLNDSSNILSLTQSYASATGDVLSISNAGTGDAIEIAGAGTRSINSTSGNLTLSTTTTGNVIINSVGNLDIDASANGENAIDINASAGGINILASGAGAGEDIDLTATGSSINLTSSEASASAITFTASNAAGQVFFDAGTTDHTADAIRIDFDVNSASADALYIEADVGTALSASEIMNGINIQVTGLAGDSATSFVNGLSITGDVTSAGTVSALALSSNFDYGVDLSGASTTVDLRLDDGLTISQTSDNDLDIVENSMTLNVDFGETSSSVIYLFSTSGIEIETDQNLRLDAGDGLPTGLSNGTDIELRAEDDVFFNLSAISAVRIDGASTDSQETGGVLDIDVDTTTASNVGIDLNYQVVDDAAATVETMTALNLLIDQFDISGNTTRGLFIQQRAVTATAAGNALDAGIVIDNADTDADAGGGGDTAAALTDAIRITGTGTGAITTGLDFDTSNIVTDIELQNAETISNDSDGKIAFGVGGSDELQLTATELAPVADGGLDLGVSAQPFGDLYLSGGQLFANNAFDIDIDDNTTSALTISEGSTNYLVFNSNNTGETATLGNSGLDSLAITTDNTAATDVGITGGLTITSGATHNSFTVTSSADTETGALVTANSLTTGKGLSVTSTSTGLSSGTLLDIDYEATGTLSAKTTTFAEITNGRTNTITSGTLSDNYDILKLARYSEQNGVGGAFSSVGSVLYVENQVVATAGTIVDTANGIEVVMDADGTGHGMIITMGVVGSPAANGVNNQGLVIDVNETTSADAVFLIRSDADGVSVDTEFRIDNDGDFQYDGTASTPASDLAEAYPSAQMLEPGDLVALDSIGGLKISKTTTPFQGGLFGAISTKPAIRMGAETIGYDVALIGRIPLKVSGEAGAIVVGDPLTASATVGHAMKATRAGMIVGYALESFDGTGTGIINAFIDVGWFAGNVIGTDGLSTILTDAVVVAPLGAASASAPTFDSFGLSLRGSAWNGNEAAAVEMMLQNVVSAPDDYRLSVRNTAESEVAYITNEGTMRIAGDLVIGGRLYPSDRGVPQTEKYIYYDGSSGSAGDFMRTNAKGWSTGSYDFAEMFPAQEKLVSGEVVAFAGDGDTVVRATGSSGERLAGIVSTRPGFLAGENVEGSYPIALAGRVPTKVSVENGAIAVGDPLTASTSAGVAMKATGFGQIVGYALEPYDATDSDDLILAYVNVGYWSGGPQTITIVENRASEMPTTGAQGFEALNMSGNIYLANNELLGIGRLEGAGALWSIERDGTMKTQALVKTVIDSYQGTKVETVAVTSPEAVVTLTGTSTLVEGKAEVRFEEVRPDFNDVISAIAPIRVIVTPSGPVSLWVVEKDQNHFVVERFVGSADVEFDWMVVGYRKGYEPEEAEEVVAEEAGTSVLLVPSDPSDPDEAVAQTEGELEPGVEAVPASPASPDETLIDPAIDDDGGEPAEEPSEIVPDQAIVAPEEPPAP